MNKKSQSVVRVRKSVPAQVVEKHPRPALNNEDLLEFAKRIVSASQPEGEFVEETEEVVEEEEQETDISSTLFIYQAWRNNHQASQLGGSF